MFNKGNKVITFYCVSTLDDPSKFLCLTCTKNEAIEYAYNYVRLKNYDHYQMWCDLRNYDKNSMSSWDEYFFKVIPIEEKRKYIVKKIKYKLKDVVAVLRMFGGCSPIGCSFDTQTEYSYLKQKLEAQYNMFEAFKNTFEKSKEEQEKKDNGKQ